MGNEQSSQNAPEQEPEQAVQEQPWSPDDISESGDEQIPATTESAPLEAEPEPSPDLSHQPPQEEGSSRSRRSRSSRSSRSATDSIAVVNKEASDSENSIAVRQETEQSETVESPINRRRPLKRKSKPNKFEQHEEEKSASSGDEESLEDNQVDQPPTDTRPQQDIPSAAKSRVPCPLANLHDCQKTFASLASARRHARTHSRQQTYECLVCERTYSRADKLKTHQKVHTRSEIQEATARNKDFQQAQDEDEEDIENDSSSSVNDVDRQQSAESETQSVHEADPLVLTAATYAVAAVPLDQSSTKESVSSTSIFDQPLETEMVAETPRPKSRLKRKRQTVDGSQPMTSSVDHLRKKRRQSLSPPTSEASVEAVDPGEKQTNDSTDPQVLLITKAAKSKSKSKSQTGGNLNGFAKPWTPGSQLYHPILNPRSPRTGSGQRVQVIIPRTSLAESSRRPMPRTVREEQTPLAKKTQPVPYSTPKGKRKAAGGVTYSSPSIRLDDEDSEDPLEPEGMATSVAKKGQSARSAPKRPKTEDDLGSDSAGDASDTKMSKKTHACQECGRRFTTRDGLQKHMKRPNVHAIERDRHCKQCQGAFSTLDALIAHQRATGHGDGTGFQGQKGNFSEAEVAKLHRWRDQFCEVYDINIPTFNQMMTDSCRRGNGFVWPYRFILKNEFLREYYETLPDRNVRSMRRYRERAFQNVPENQEWTQEDDEELMLLVKELGQKWVEIGQRMTRTQDSVNQRWRFKLKYHRKINQGEWVPSEEDQLKAAVARVKERLGSPLDPYADVRIPWDSVSKELDETRTPQQCSNKWRLMYLTRQGNKFVRPSAATRRIHTSSNVATPSRMSQRLAGNTSSAQRSTVSSQKKHISDEFVHESDDGKSAGEEEEEEEKDDVVSEDESAGEDDVAASEGENEDEQPRDAEVDAGESPAVCHNPLRTRTPQTGKGLSQVFAQTQANTSALKAPPTTGRRSHHSQPDMPTPGIPIQHRPDSSPWLSVNANSKSDILQHRDAPLSQEDEAAIMAEPASSDKEDPVIEGTPDDDSDDSDATTSSDGSSTASSSETDNEESGDESMSVSKSGSDSASQASGQSGEESDDDDDDEEDDDDDDDMVRDTHNDSFVRSLQSPPTNDRLNQSSNGAGEGAGASKKYWEKIIRGEDKNDDDDSSTDSEDEGDIMHH